MFIRSWAVTNNLICIPEGKEEDEKVMDFSHHYTGIVIGVACAAIFAILSIITFSHTRRRLQERRHGSLTNSRRRPVFFSDNDVFQQNAPPTYDDGRIYFVCIVLCYYCKVVFLSPVD